MKKTYRKYIAIACEADKNVLKDDVIIFDKDIPETPYYFVEIKVLKYEPNFSGDRQQLPLVMRLRMAFRELMKVLKKSF